MAGRIAVVMLVALLGGCAGGVPAPIAGAPPGDPPLAAVRAAPQQYAGAEVRWGGQIVGVRNETEATQIEVVERRLDADGRPRAEDRSAGRFLARVAGFLDPAIYAAGRELTVRGQLAGTVERAIDEFRYTYPLVQAEHVQLWPERPPPLPAYPYYDPFWYDPWYPWGWPYYPRRYYR
jgi:outer membrane lipoprotein